MTQAPDERMIVGETGPDWEPDATTKYYAQIEGIYAFGSTPEAAIAALEAIMNGDPE
ncbi:hypothetical protein NKH16_19955 [Mesorhizobium sp. M1307]|uniref:hypothetical protein n=1 Tax=Mesorhizobium sp. M1307 TaxID=2957079 RepID=UPI003335AE4F